MPSPLQAVGLAELPDDGGGVLMLGVDGVVEAADVGGGEFAGEIGERGAELGESRERGLADDGDGVVGRKVVAVVFEGDESKRVDEAVRRIAGDDVDLMIDESAVDEAEVHDFGRFGKTEIVAIAQRAEAVGAFEEFVANAGAPLRGDGRDVGDFLEMEIFRVIAADDHGKSVFEAEGLGDFEVEAIGVHLFDAAVDGVRVVAPCGSLAVRIRGFVEDGGKGGAGVFDVEVELTGEQRFVDEECSAEVRLANDGDASASFDVLGEKLGENDLLGKEFGADSDFGLRRSSATRKEIHEVK
jgi:hypothetical protein